MRKNLQKLSRPGAVILLLACFGIAEPASAQVKEFALCDFPPGEGITIPSSCATQVNSASASRATGILKASASGARADNFGGAGAFFADELTLTTTGPNVATHVMHVHGKISGDAFDGTTNPVEVYMNMTNLGTLFPIAEGIVFIDWDGSTVSIKDLTGAVSNLSLDPSNIHFDLSISGAVGSGAYGFDEQIRLAENSARTMNIDFSHTITNDIILPPGVGFTSQGGFLSAKISAVPVPPALGLLGSVLAAITALRRRTKKTT